MFIGVGICFGLISISNTFVPVFFFSGWGKVVLILQLFSPQVIIIGISNCLGSQYYTPAGLRKKSAMYIIIGAIVNLILNLVLIPKFASAGATFASIIAELTISILFLKNSDGYLDVKFLGHILWKKVIAGILMGAVIMLYGFWTSPAIIKLFIQFLAGSLTYVLTLLVLKDNSIKLFLKFIHRG